MEPPSRSFIRAWQKKKKYGNNTFFQHVLRQYLIIGGQLVPCVKGAHTHYFS